MVAGLITGGVIALSSFIGGYYLGHRRGIALATGVPPTTHAPFIKRKPQRVKPKVPEDKEP